MISQLSPKVRLDNTTQFHPIHRIDPAFQDIESRMRHAHATHLGYPYNLIGRQAVPSSLSNYLINNLGDPFVGSHYGSEVCDLEREVVSWLMQLWQCEDKSQYWGSVGASGTEGNFWAFYLAREALKDGILLYSQDAHYSIPKAAKILKIEAIEIASLPSGEIAIESLEKTLGELNGRPVILALTCGTTVKGAHDDISLAMNALDRSGYGPDKSYVHLDGALNAMVLPFVQDVPFSIRPSFRHGIDSISTSGHKMIGTPMPCGVLIAKRSMVDRVASSIAYLRSNDTTLMGSRNGHAVLAIWSRLFGHGFDGYQKDVQSCLDLSRSLVTKMRQAGVPILCNSFSLTVIFPQPSETIVNRYQLACNRGESHAIVMPNVTNSLIDEFVTDYIQWWKTREATE